MKILIWIGCFLCFAILRVGYIHSGILLGAIPRALLAMLGFCITWIIAKKLCDKWDQRKEREEYEKNSISNHERIDDISIIFNRKRIFTIVLSVLLIISLICNIIQAIDINDYEDIVSEQHKTIDDKSSTISSLIDDGFENWNLLQFYEKHVVVVSDDGTNLYHKYGCEDFDDSSFWAYNVEKAEQLGYIPHKGCCT